MSLSDKITKIANSATAPMEKFALAATGINTLLASIAFAAVGPLGPLGFIALPAAIILTGTLGITLGAKLIGEKAPTLLDAAQNVTAFMASGLAIASRGIKGIFSTATETTVNASTAPEKAPCPSCVSKIQPANTSFNNAVSPTTEPAAKAEPCTAPINIPKI